MRKQQGRIEKKSEYMNVKAKDMPKTIFNEQCITYLYEAILTYPFYTISVPESNFNPLNI